MFGVGDDYWGWVAWAGETPYFEANPQVASMDRLAPLIPGGESLPIRPESHNVRQWKDLPHDELTRVALFFNREQYDGGRPALVFETAPGSRLRYIQMKAASVLWSTQGGGQQRTGVFGYRMGYYDMINRRCLMWEVNRRDGVVEWGECEHPCLPRSPGWSPGMPIPRGFGFGFNPRVIGEA